MEIAEKVLAEITTLDTAISLSLTIPTYQRPYRWSTKSCNILFKDLLDAFENNINEYRIGTVILHKNNSNEFEIVDGQQRLTTLSILLYCLGDKSSKLLHQNYNKLSDEAIFKNHEILTQRTYELSDDKQEKFKYFLLNKCTLVKIITDDIQEAFQFFDSQNSRGKALEPHDLLKAYHLREMSNEPTEIKVSVINRWENEPQVDLSNLFRNYLFPLTQWYKSRDGLDYSTKKIDTFKGIKSNNISNFAIYHRASNLYIEQFNSNSTMELISLNKLNQFQLTQPLIAGKRFFDYSLHYLSLLANIQEKIKKLYTVDETPDIRSGDKYIKELFECVTMFFADKFGLDSLSESNVHILYKWCYSLRLTMSAVYVQSINKYALGNHERLNLGLPVFNIISELNSPEDLQLYHFQSIKTPDNEKYSAIYKKITGIVEKKNG